MSEQDDFTAAQQAADMAYAMTMELTSDGAQASDDYKCVMTAYFAKQGKRMVMVSTPTTTATDYNAMSESDKEMYRVFYELGGQAAVDAQVSTDKRAAETNARIRAIGNERVIYGTNGTKNQRDYGMGYND